MTSQNLVSSGGRTLIVLSSDQAQSAPANQPFATLLLAFDEEERRRSEAVIGLLLDRGCLEFCCVGPESEELHDTIDGIIENQEAFDVVTTWHTDESDACEYFLLAAGARPATLLALVASHPELVARLEKEAAKRMIPRRIDPGIIGDEFVR